MSDERLPSPRHLISVLRQQQADAMLHAPCNSAKPAKAMTDAAAY